jgi:hypothetical protein
MSFDMNKLMQQAAQMQEQMQQMQEEAALQAAYRFLQTPGVTYEKLMRPHVQQTRAEARQQRQVLLIQDTTEVDYQQHPTTTGLGPIGNGTHHGYLLQSVLAVVPESRQVLGLMQQEPFLRHPAPKGETRREREQRADAGQHQTATSSGASGGVMPLPRPPVAISSPTCSRSAARPSRTSTSLPR